MNKFKVRTYVLSFVRTHIVLTIFLLLSVLLAALSGLLPPFILQHILDDYLAPMIQGSVSSPDILLPSILYFFSYLLVGLSTIFENLMIDLFGQKLIHNLRYQMLEKSHYLKASYYTSHGAGELQSRIMDDVQSIETLFASGLVSLAVSAIKVIGILVSLFTFSIALGFVILAAIPIIYLLAVLFRKAMLKAQLINRKAINRQANHISETIDSIRTIENLNEENFREKEYHELLKEAYKARNKTSICDSLFSPILEILKALLVVIVTYLVLWNMNRVQDTIILGLSVGTFAASISFIGSIFSPIEDIGMELQLMQEGVSGMKRVQDFMNEEAEEKKEETITKELIFASQKKDLIEIKDLTFRYEDGEKNIFSHTSFSIKPKEKVTLIGRTGVGKTTLFRLILGLYSHQGEILLNGYETYRIPNEEKRKIFGYVEQGFSAIRGTILEQITLKDASISEEEVKKVMKEAFLDDYVIREIKGGYDAVFAENLFSRGQLQLLSLARALVSNPEILLLDEISANLDSKTEKEIIKALADASKTRTVISISHRLSDQLGFDRTIEIK